MSRRGRCHPPYRLPLLFMGAYPSALSTPGPVVLKPEYGSVPAADPITPSRLLHYVAGPAVAVRPERALRANLPFWVIGPFLMRAAYDSIHHDDRQGAMILNEPEDVATNGRICPNIALLDEPTPQGDRLGALRGHNPNCHFAGAFVIRPVEPDRRDRIAPKATTCLLPQR